MGVETLENRGLGVEYGNRKWYGTHLYLRFPKKQRSGDLQFEGRYLARLRLLQSRMVV